MSSVTRTYFMLSVTDMPRAVAFYREVLGPVIRHESDTWSELKLGDATVALHAAEPAAPKYTGLAAEVPDLQAAYHAVQRAGGQVRSGPMADASGQLSYEVADTEGNVFTMTGPVPGAAPAAGPVAAPAAGPDAGPAAPSPADAAPHPQTPLPAPPSAAAGGVA